MTRNNLISLLSITLSIKLILFVIGVLSFTTIPFSKAGYENNFHYPVKESKNIIPFKTWDAQHYLFLSEVGYKKDQESNRFFPLYPFLIFLTSKIGVSSLVSSYFLSTIFSIGSVIFLFLLSQILFKDEKISLTSCILLLSFPSAFFMSLPYSESLLIFLALLFFYFLEKGKASYSFLISIFLPLTRPTGIFIEAPILAYLFYKKRKFSKFSFPTFNKKITLNFSASYLGILFPLFGVLIYFLIMTAFLGDTLSGIKGLSSLSSWNLANFFDPLSLLKNLISTPLVIHSFQRSLIDRIFFLFFLSTLPFVYKKLPKHYFYYTLAIGMVPIFGSFTSYTRYLLPAFPIFIVLSYYLTTEKFKSILYVILFAFISLQTVLFIMHILNYWAA